MPSYRFLYFNLRGHAEVVRLAFALAEVEYEDVRFELDKWPEQKSGVHFGELPVLEIDGKPLIEEGAIYRYLARTFNLYGKDINDAMKIDMALEIVPKLFQPPLNIFSEKDENKKAELQKNAKEVEIPLLLRKLEMILKDNGSNGYYAGNSITIADLAVFHIMEKVNMFVGNLQDDFPLVKKSMENVEANPKIKAWIQKRPNTQL